MLQINPITAMRLRDNWHRAQALACYAELRLYDECSDWQCYLLAMNPENDNEVFCIISGGKNLEPDTTLWSLHEIGMLFNANGEGVRVDTEFRRREAVEVFKRLKGGL